MPSRSIIEISRYSESGKTCHGKLLNGDKVLPSGARAQTNVHRSLNMFQGRVYGLKDGILLSPEFSSLDMEPGQSGFPVFLCTFWKQLLTFLIMCAILLLDFARILVFLLFKLICLLDTHESIFLVMDVYEAASGGNTGLSINILRLCLFWRESVVLL